jgi:nicotinamidase-related amidase
VELRFPGYAAVAAEAIGARRTYNLRAVSSDHVRVGVLGIDWQYTFCHPKAELFVAGRSGSGAIDDAQRFGEFIYRHADIISGIHLTMDTHLAYAIHLPGFVVDQQGDPAPPFTLISVENVEQGKWTASPLMASALNVNLAAANRYLLHYTRELKRKGRYDLTVWPYHAMLGSASHAVIAGLAEACFFHAVARGAQTGFEVKGLMPLTENYSVLGPEVLTDQRGNVIAQRNTAFIELLLKYDALIIAGQAKSHCVAWTIDDLLEDILKQDQELAGKVYLLEDCTSAVVVPGLDYTDDAAAAFKRFKDAGMHLVTTSQPIDTWPDFPVAA